LKVGKENFKLLKRKKLGIGNHRKKKVHMKRKKHCKKRGRV